MRTTGYFVLFCVFVFTIGNGAPVEKRRDSTKEILELESLLKKSAGEDKQVFPSELKAEAKAKEAKLAAEAEEAAVDLPLVAPEMQVDGLAEKDELEAQLKIQSATQAKMQQLKQQRLQAQQQDNEESSHAEDTSETEDPSEDQEESASEEEIEDTEEEPESPGDLEKREQELFERYLRESPELWQQLVESLENDNNDWGQGRYPNENEDEYPAVLEEWRAASEDTPQNYIPQYDFPPQYYPVESMGQQAELENDLPEESEELGNLEDLQEYYGDKLAKVGPKKRGMGRPAWADADKQAVASDPVDTEKRAKGQSSVQGNLIM